MNRSIPLIGALLAFGLGMWITGSSSAAGTSATTAAPTQLIQQEEPPAPGFDCPEHEGEGGADAPSSAAPSDQGAGTADL